MNDTLLILSENTQMQDIIKKTIETENIKAIIIEKQNLIQKIYGEKPSVIIIDTDSLSENALQTIESTLSVEYIPTICIFSSTDSVNKSHIIKDSFSLPVEHISSSLNLIIKQATVFYHKYHDISQSYDTIVLMNDEINHTIDYYIKALPEYENEIIAQYLKIIYMDNLLVDNPPMGIWIINEAEKICTASLFLVNGSDFVHKKTLTFEQNDVLIFTEFVETGFIKNLTIEEYSDANTLTDILPEKILSIATPKSNITGYGSNSLIVIAFDYNGIVTDFEMNTIKTLAIKINLMINMKQSIKNVENAFSYAMNAIARAAEGKDDITGHHIKRVNLFSKILAQELNLGVEFTGKLETAAQMHDVGKIYVNDLILSKPGKLTDSEFEEMKKHTVYGQRIIGDSEYLKMANQIARSHHEKYDGSGYPDGKKGDNIPLAARIVALADIYDALRSERSYKPAFSHEQAYDIIVNGDGRVEPSHFDPTILYAFKKVHKIFDSVYQENVY